MKRVLAALMAAMLALACVGALAESEMTWVEAPAEADVSLEGAEASAETDVTLEAGEEPAETGGEPAAAAQGEAAEAVEPAPTEVPGRLSGLKIGIDPGHQEHANNGKETIAPNSKKTKPKVSSGTRGRKTKIPEYITVLEIAFALRDALEAEGAEVRMTRETHDVDISNQERAKMMNEWGADLVLRIHCDGANKKSAHGIGLFVNKSFDISEESKRAAECILPRMVEATGAKRRGVYERDTYTGLNWSEVPCILVECGYATNPEEDVNLNTPEYQRKLAEGMTEGICDYFGRNGAGE